MSAELSNGDVIQRSAHQSINQPRRSANQPINPPRSSLKSCSSQLTDSGDSTRNSDYLLDDRILELLPNGNSGEGSSLEMEGDSLSVTSNESLEVLALDVVDDIDVEALSDRLKINSTALTNGITVLPPFALRKIIEEYDDDGSDGEEGSSSPLVEPILHGKVHKR